MIGDVMKEVISRFWYNLLQKLNGKINQWLNSEKMNTEETRIDDDGIVNFFVMILKKVLNHVFMQCDFEIVSDSVIAEPLRNLCDDLQSNCYKIGVYMLGGSDTPQNISECWVVPSVMILGEKRKLYHTYLRGDRIRITEMIADEITECYMILESVKRNDKPYLLCRRHALNEKGDLKISYFIADEQAHEVNIDIPEWRNIINTETTYVGANHIGFGRYKSPVISLNNDDTYGKPLNYGCSVIERKIQACLEQIRIEFKSKDPKLFPDESIVRRKDRNGNPLGMYCIDEYIYPIQHKMGADAKMIDVYSPEIRESSYYVHLKELLKQYEALCGVNNILVKDNTANATATEIKALCIDNISLEDNIRQAIRQGNIMTLEADGIYLNIRRDLWSYDETWTDIYDDEQKRLNNMLTMYSNGAAEQIDLIKYWFPTLSDDEAQEKLDRINESRKNNTQAVIENMMNM